MNDYTSYYEPSNEKMIRDLETTFLQTLKSTDGEDVKVDDLDCRVVIHNHTNPLDEYKEDRKIMCLNEISMNRGSIIETLKDGNKYLVVTDIDKNEVYQTGKMRKSNYTLKYKDSTSTLISLPAIIGNKTMYSSGVKDGKFFINPDSDFNITIQSNEYTSQIKRGYRFVISDMIGKVTYVDSYSQDGLINLSLEEETPRPTDDLVNGIADNSDVINDTPSEPEEPPVEVGYDIQIIGNTSIVMMDETMYTAKVYQDGGEVTKEVVWTISDSGLVELGASGNSCTLYANDIGNVILRCELVEDSGVFNEISINIAMW